MSKSKQASTKKSRIHKAIDTNYKTMALKKVHMLTNSNINQSSCNRFMPDQIKALEVVSCTYFPEL